MRKAQTPQKSLTEYQKKLARIQTNHLTRELLLYMERPDTYELSMDQEEFHIAMENLMEID